MANGESSILSWQLARASTATLSYNGVEETLDPNGGSMLISPLDTTVYALRASGPGGEVAREVTIVVNTPTPTLPPPPTETPAPGMLTDTTAIDQANVFAAEVTAPTTLPTSLPSDTPTLEAPAPTPTVIVVANNEVLADAARQKQAAPTPERVVLDLHTSSSAPSSTYAEIEIQNQQVWNEYLRRVLLYGVATLGVVVPALFLILGVLLSGVWREQA